ncbi:very short patch repair endonuclease [Nitratidesulfovibrio vulgaris]|uniref:Very short patch repair endonuclease n=1 Tax=Nitratidesulfovibrio vulgaris (strain ATCC 29579 / DSM 644 / CCUG 34227 / NCIMB 8303 / VKM B-1760 / Hildenborough) TaxID=882 RepID=Q727L2_NITV2|nr:DNA mismatch endonuclease Vsr [Nitratidesulfovibrio vulgaris]AAS97315.1 DNA mismatch endonuclease Vsr, putative [Nitratidesulfovibrio vulgaris str. Hildenborough]
MADIVDSATRSRMMSGIKGRNTKPERLVRSYLHAAGFRFRLHRKDLPGCPDIVLPRYRAIIFVHGCFWHRHEGCNLASFPATRVDFWESKFAANVERDRRNETALAEAGWRVIIIWECQIRAGELSWLPDAITGQG